MNVTFGDVVDPGAAPSLVPLADLALVDPGLVGGKARGLATLAAAGLAVPEGFVVTTAAHRAARANGGGGAVPAALAEAVGARLEPFGEGPYAVRSSAADEDGADRSNAGQYATLLGVSRAGVVAAISECWRSAEGERAGAYRRAGGEERPPPDMAVLVQRLAPAEASGVVFTVDPLSGDAAALVVNASWGLGETVVSGIVTPDEYRVARADGRLLRFAPGWKDVMLVHDGAEVREVEVPPERREAPALDPGVLEAVRLGALSCEALLERPADLEFCTIGGEVRWLQCRPITALAPAG
jgi:pyruvate,water dikinase